MLTCGNNILLNFCSYGTLHCCNNTNIIIQAVNLMANRDALQPFLQLKGRLRYIVCNLQLLLTPSLIWAQQERERNNYGLPEPLSFYTLKVYFVSSLLLKVTCLQLASMWSGELIHGEMLSHSLWCATQTVRHTLPFFRSSCPVFIKCLNVSFSTALSHTATHH